MEASWHTAVLCGVNEGSGTKNVVQQVTGQNITLLTLEVKRQLQNLDQVRAIRQQLVAIHPSYLTCKKVKKKKCYNTEYWRREWARIGLFKLIHLRKKLQIPQKLLIKLLLVQHFLICWKTKCTSDKWQNWDLLYMCFCVCFGNLLAEIWFMALQQCGTNILSDSAGWHWLQKKKTLHVYKIKLSEDLFDVQWAGKTYLGSSATHVGHHSPSYTCLKDVGGCKVEDLFQSHLLKH